MIYDRYSLYPQNRLYKRVSKAIGSILTTCYKALDNASFNDFPNTCQHTKQPTRITY